MPGQVRRNGAPAASSRKHAAPARESRVRKQGGWRRRSGVLLERLRRQPHKARGEDRGALSIVVLHLPRGYLLEGDREVVFRGRIDHRRRELVEGPLAEVVVVAVDLPCALGGDDHAGVIRVDLLEQAVDAGGDPGCGGASL